MKKLIFLYCTIFILGLLGLFLAGCGGGGGGGGGDGGAVDDGLPNDNPNPGGNASNSPAFSGFGFTLKTGDYWEYSWDYENDYWDSFGGGSETTDNGTYRLTIGAPRVIQGISTYELITTGYSGLDDWMMTPRWRYLAMDGNKLLGSEDGVALVTLFDAQTGMWPGSGFFTQFTANTLCVGSAGTIDNNYISGPAIMVSESSEVDQCHYFPGYGTICGGDLDETLTLREYYSESIGPLGFYSYSAMSDMTSAYPWSSSTAKNIGLVKCSLRGDTVDYDFETEPNNSPAAAQTMTAGWDIFGRIAYEDRDQSTTVYLNNIQEIEPNNSRTAYQAVNAPSRVQGAASQTDTSTSFTFVFNGQTHIISAEDWYRFSLNSASPMVLRLAFTDSTAVDLDLYLFSGSSTTPYLYSITDNPAAAQYSELIQEASLPAGTYTIAVDAYVTSGSIPYILDISPSNNGNMATVEDWYSFTLNVSSGVSISLGYDPSEPSINSDIDLYLFNQAGTAMMAHSRNGVTVPEKIVINLDPGTYKVGVDLANHWNARYILALK